MFVMTNPRPERLLRQIALTIPAPRDAAGGSLR